jgi:cell division protein FtsZ
MGALTVAVVTKPFAFEGAQRKNIAERALDNLVDKVDTIITIPNDRLLQVIDKKTSLLDAFAIVDEVLKQGVQGISELITIPGLVNVDFADVKSIMKDAGSALMGIGRSSGENRAVEAAKLAIDSPLLEMSIKGAKGVLFTIAGDSSLSMYEVNEAAEVITSALDPNARVIFGAVIDEAMDDELKITVIATGFNVNKSREEIAAVKSYTPNPIFAKEEKDEVVAAEKEIKPNVFKKKKEIKEEIVEEDDELDIPTFIRKKMN